jgi:hypothetical protein
MSNDNPPPDPGMPPVYGAQDTPQDYTTPQGYGTPPPYQGQPYPGGYGTAPSQVGMPPSYLPWAVSAAIGGVLFSLILGFPSALVASRYARKVKTAWNAGDQQGAMLASKRALTWSIVATALDVLGLVLVVFVLPHLNSTTT